MKYKLLPRRVSLLVYDDSSDVDYVASCQININGTHGTIDTLNGNNFYKFLVQEGLKPFLELGLTEVGVAVTPSHLRLIRHFLSDKIDIEENGGMFNSNGIDLLWVTFTEKK